MDPDTHQIMTQVYQAKKDNAAADELIALMRAVPDLRKSAEKQLMLFDKA